MLTGNILNIWMLFFNHFFLYSPRRRGPVNGDECYFWRTTGCHFGDKCRYKHIPDQKGKDRKPWQPWARCERHAGKWNMPNKVVPIGSGSPGCKCFFCNRMGHHFQRIIVKYLAWKDEAGNDLLMFLTFQEPLLCSYSYTGSRQVP